MKHFPVGTPVVVHWLDATVHNQGWRSPDKKDCQPDRVVSLGFVVRYNKLTLTIAADAAPKKTCKGDVNRTISIPMGMVTSIKSLTEVRKT